MGITSARPLLLCNRMVLKMAKIPFESLSVLHFQRLHPPMEKNLNPPEVGYRQCWHKKNGKKLQSESGPTRWAKCLKLGTLCLAERLATLLFVLTVHQSLGHSRTFFKGTPTFCWTAFLRTKRLLHTLNWTSWNVKSSKILFSERQLSEVQPGKCNRKSEPTYLSSGLFKRKLAKSFGKYFSFSVWRPGGQEQQNSYVWI